MVLRHKALIRRLCWWHASGNTSLCDDLVQDVLLTLWRRRGTLREGASQAEEYLWVRFQCRSVLQHFRRSRKPDTVPLDENMPLATESVSYSDIIAELAEGLTDYEHRALELMLDGYSVDDMAKLLGIKPASVSQMRYRIVEKMKLRSQQGIER